MRNKRTTTRNIAICALLTSLALVLGYFEHLIPLAVSIPGIKLGLGNISVLLALLLLGPWPAFGVMLCKVLLGGLLYGGVSGMMYALSGGLLSWVGMVLAQRTGLSVIGLSVIGALLHNIGQIALAAIIVQTVGVFGYLPLLLIAGVVTGILTGIVVQSLQKRLVKFTRS